MFEEKPYLKKIEILHGDVGNKEAYPFCLPLISKLNSIKFHKDVTFIIGENGSGKSTLIEAIATAWGFNPEGGNKNFNFETESTHSNLSEYIKIHKSHARPKDGFFLRAESYYNVATYIDEIDDNYKIRESFGGESLHHQSHGESFMAMMIHKLHGNGLYIFDEPEAALSPSRQIEALNCINRLVNEGSQFIIATHSPILMSFHKAKILQIQNGELEEVDYLKTEHYQVTKNFLDQQSNRNGIDINTIFD